MIDLVVNHAPLIGMFLFMTIFLVVLVWAYWPRNKERLESYGTIPLKESQDGE